MPQAMNNARRTDVQGSAVRPQPNGRRRRHTDQAVDVSWPSRLAYAARRFPGRHLLHVAIFMLAIALMIAGCGAEEDAGEGLPQTEAATANAMATAERSATPVDDASGEGRQIVIWAPPFWGSDEESPAGQIVGNAITQFEQTHGAARVEIHTKAESGAADMLSLLRSAQVVAPAVLPDMVLMDSQDIWRLIELGMVEPLTETLALDMPLFFPFARQSVIHNEALYGFPYAADLVHMGAMDPAAGSLPADWSALLAGNRRYLFPASGTEGELSLLMHYLAAGGTVTGEDVTAEQTALDALFSFYATGSDQGIIPPENTALASWDDVWQAVGDEEAAIMDISAAFLLGQGELPPTMHYAPPQSMDGAPPSVARSWAFVVLSQDPAQRELVLALLQTLLQPDVHGQWSRFVRLLPTTPDAAAVWTTPQPYAEFLLAKLGQESTHPVPNNRTYAEFIRRLQQMQQAVLNGEISATEAATRIQSGP